MLHRLAISAAGCRIVDQEGITGSCFFLFHPPQPGSEILRVKKKNVGIDAVSCPGSSRRLRAVRAFILGKFRICLPHI